MKIKVKLTQIREGYVEIEASDVKEALTKAETQYNGQGKELPDMEDVGPLRITVVPAYEKKQETAPREGELSEEEVETYLKKQGYPYPSAVDIDIFLAEGKYHDCYIEAVRNEYDYVDVDRWFHLMDVLDTHISFRAAMLIDNALWGEDIEIHEINTTSDLLDTPQQSLKTKILELCETIMPDGKLPQNIYEVTAEDLLSLTKALHLEIPPALKEKESLSSLIHNASSRAGTSAASPQPSPSYEK